MNRLDLVRRLAVECGVPSTNLTSTLNQTGEYGRLVGWIDDAWNDIQTAHQDWGWMRTSASWATVDAQYQYTTVQCGITAGTFGMWDKDTFRNYVTASGVQSEILMSETTGGYDAWRDTYLYGGTRATRTRPVEFAIGPDKSVFAGPVPSAGYTMTADYFTAPLAMAADTDIPALPTQFHMAIVFRAMMSYGGYESATEVYQRGEIEFGKLMKRLDIDRLPQMLLSGPLA